MARIHYEPIGVFGSVMIVPTGADIAVVHLDCNFLFSSSKRHLPRNGGELSGAVNLSLFDQHTEVASAPASGGPIKLSSGEISPILAVDWPLNSQGSADMGSVAWRHT